MNPLDVITPDDWDLIAECIAIRLARCAREIENASDEHLLRAYEAKYARINNLALKVQDVRP